jgi:hypothetical protein
VREIYHDEGLVPRRFVREPTIIRPVTARYARHSRDIHHDVAPPTYLGLMAQSQLAEVLEWSASCTHCDNNLDHCHGVAVVNEWSAMCSEDPDCRVAIELHQFVSYEE